MKLSLSFLSTVLLAPFSEASVALIDRWTIGTVNATSSSVFEYQGMSKAWLGTDPNLKIRATFYDGGCKVDGTLDLSPWYAATGYNPPAVTPAAPDVTLEGGESAFTDPSLSWDEDNLRLNFATNPRVMTAMGDFGSDGVLVYCVRLGLYAGGISSDEINFQESIVTLNITMDGTFTIDEFGVAPKAQGESTAAQEYTVSASLCDAEGVAYDQGSDEASAFNQGAAIVVCINLDDAGLADQVEITSVDEFTWTRDGTSSQTAVGTPGVAGFGSDGLANNGLTMMTMNADKNKATITSILFAKFYESVGTVTANGSVTMAFGASATPLLQLNGAPIDFDSSSEAIYSDTELSLVQDTHADINATTLGNFGSSDFSVEFTMSSTGGDLIPDSNQNLAILFTRSRRYHSTYIGPGGTYIGPGAYLSPDNMIRVWMEFRESMFCHNALPNLDSAFSYVLKFERIESILNLTISNIDGVVVKECTKEMINYPTINTSMFVNLPLRFGGNIRDDGVSDNANLNATLSNIKLVGETSRRRLGGTNNNDNNRRRRRHLQEGGSAKSAFDVSVDLNKAEDGPVALQQTAGAGVGTSITVVATIVGLVSALLLA